MNIELDGVAALTKQLKALASVSETGAVLKGAVSDAMGKVRDQARQNVPVGRKRHRTYKGRLVSPGFAKRSLRVLARLSKDKTRAYALLGVRSEAFYALQFIELGTSRIPRRPWLVPAFEASKDESLREIGASMRRRIELIAARRK